MIPITDSILFNEREIRQRFVRATGPDGQNVDKDATAVELRLDLDRSSLPSDLKERLVALGGRNVTTDGVLVVVSRAHRSQAQNRDAARARLVSLLQRAATPPGKRKTTKPGAVVREERLGAKKRQSAIKRLRHVRADD